MTFGEWIEFLTWEFRELGWEHPRQEAEILTSGIMGQSRSELLLSFPREVSEEDLAELRRAYERRKTGEPMAYILGFKDFYKSRFIVEPGVLVPRPETELLVEEVARLFQDQSLRVVDLGCGSGCIGLSVLEDFPQAQLLAVDSSVKAIEVTNKNMARFRWENRCQTLRCSVTELDQNEVTRSWWGAADVVVANPPYISYSDIRVQKEVREFEPAEALFAEEQGFAAIRAWADVADRLLRPGGYYIFEIGCDQLTKTKDFLTQHQGFIGIHSYKDYAGLDRFVRVQKR